MALKWNQFNSGATQADVWLKHIYPSQLIQEKKNSKPKCYRILPTSEIFNQIP